MAPVLIIYSLESRHSKSEIIQASNFCFLYGKISQLLIFSFYAKFNLSALSISSLMLFVVSLALYLGITIRKKISVTIYKKVIRVFLLILAVTLLINVVLNTGTIDHPQ